jgi:hypothetical protein
MSKLPKFLCIGAQKAGTTWLHEILSTHPEVFLPRIKELYHFVEFEDGEPAAWRDRVMLEATIAACNEYIHNERHAIRPGFVQYLLSFGAPDRFSDEWYKRVFSAAWDEALTGEITPEYMAMSPEGIDRIKALLGDVKIVLLLRDPVERLWSQVRMVANETGQDPTVAYWNISQGSALKRNSNYAKFIPTWREKISSENLGIFNFHALAQDPRAFYQDVLNFLSLSPHETDRVGDIIHQGVGREIPEDILADLTGIVAPQNEYLDNVFGKDWRDGPARMNPS